MTAVSNMKPKFHCKGIDLTKVVPNYGIWICGFRILIDKEQFGQVDIVHHQILYSKSVFNREIDVVPPSLLEAALRLHKCPESRFGSRPDLVSKIFKFQ